MTKKQVAEFLGVTTKTVERLVAKRELFPTLGQGKTGKVLVFDADAVARYKTRRDAIFGTPADSTALVPVEPAELQAPTSPDKPRHNSDIISTPLLSQLAEAFALALDRNASPLLTVQQAAVAFNLSQSAIKAAIKSGALVALPIGQRGGKVLRRSDVETWIDRQWNQQYD